MRFLREGLIAEGFQGSRCSTLLHYPHLVHFRLKTTQEPKQRNKHVEGNTAYCRLLQISKPVAVQFFLSPHNRCGQYQFATAPAESGPQRPRRQIRRGRFRCARLPQAQRRLSMALVTLRWTTSSTWSAGLAYRTRWGTEDVL